MPLSVEGYTEDELCSLEKQIVILTICKALRICSFWKIGSGYYLEILAEYNAEHPVSKLCGTAKPIITVILSISLIRDDE